MLSGFVALRSALPTNLRARTRSTVGNEAVQRDIARVLEIWRASLAAGGGPFLLGKFSIADCMYFPVATRFRTYGVALPEDAQLYCERLFALPHVLELEALAAQAPAIDEYDAALRA